MIEDYLSDLTRLEILKLRRCIVPTLGYFVAENGLNIFQPQMVSLFELLHCEERSELKKAMTVGDKYQLIFNLAKIMNTFHAFSPPMLHGHLSSHNVFLEFQTLGGQKRFSGVRVGDIELTALIKYASTFYSYRNLSVWSCPESLNAGRKNMDSVTTESDVYSFGMIMWELWHETVPFDDDVTLCQQYVL